MKNENPIITPIDQERFPLLELTAKPCSFPLKEEEEQCIVDMDGILNVLDEEAIGLAAPQIGVSRRIFLLRNGIDEDGNAYNNVYINPKIIHQSKEQKRGSEGCLSLPGMGCVFKRPKSVVLEYYSISGDKKTEEFSGLFARAVQHEVDHINGVLLSYHFEQEIAKQPRRTRFGMVLTPHREKIIARRRAKKKRARAQARHARR